MTVIGEGVLQMSVADYLAFEEESEIKHEYIDGEVYPMTGGTLHHAAVMMNVGGELAAAKGFRLPRSEQRYANPHQPDALCLSRCECRLRRAIDRIQNDDAAESDAGRGGDIAVYNRLDRVIKRDYYETVQSIQAYLVIDQHRVLVELYERRGEAGS